MPNKEVTLRLGNYCPIIVEHVSQGDTDWTWVFQVVDDHGQIYAPVVRYAILAGNKPDGHAFAYLCTKDGDTYKLPPSAYDIQMTAAAGDVRAELRMLGSNGKGLGSCNFTIRVEEGPEGAVTVASGSSLPAYLTILNKIGTIPDDVAGYITEWLETHISGGQGVVVDNTLTVQGAAADAKAAGDRLKALEEATIETDATLSVSGAAADSKAVGDIIGDLAKAKALIDSLTLANGWFQADGTIKSDSGYRYTVEYLPASIFSFASSVLFYTRYIYSVVFYDANKDVISALGTESAGTDYYIRSVKVPEGAVYCRVSQSTANMTPFPIKLKTLSEAFGTGNVEKETDLPVNIADVLTGQGGLGTKGEVKGYNQWKLTDYIKVAPGMWLKYSGCGNIGGNATLCPIVFYDADKNFVEAVNPADSQYLHIYNQGWRNAPASGTSMNFGYVFVPESAAYCRLSGYINLQPTLEIGTPEPWAGKKCVFFGDSITAGISSAEKYCNILAMLRGITVANYAVNGSVLVTNGMDRVTAFATDYAGKDVDAFIFAYGTNDWGGGKPLGEWYTTDSNGVRTLTTDTTTFRGAWAAILTYLKTNFDGKKIILMTPIHRGAGSYASDLTRNSAGLYLEDYVKVIKEAGEIFAVDVIDLYSESGLNPNINPSTAYFTPNDRLHPNVEGHRQMAKVIAAKMGGMEI